MIKQLRRRHLTPVQPFFAQGPAAFDDAELQTVLGNLAGDLDQRIDKVRRAAASETNVPPYNRRFSGRLSPFFFLALTAGTGMGVLVLGFLHFLTVAVQQRGERRRAERNPPRLSDEQMRNLERLNTEDRSLKGKRGDSRNGKRDRSRK